jgi:hypothetical protein
MEPGSSKNEGYLDQLERFKAHAEQEPIQIPEFSEDSSVGGRFRPREIEDVRRCLLIHNMSYTHLWYLLSNLIRISYLAIVAKAANYRYF